MKFIYASLLLLFFSSLCNAQKLNGQWKGGFLDASSSTNSLGSSNIDYVLELDINGTVVSGYSYTYFSEGSKPYYTICKVTGKLNKKAKEVMITEIERTKFNTPPDFRNCFQTHLLKYSKLNRDTEQLVGSWIPAPNQLGDCGKGRTILYRKIVRNIKKEVVKAAPPASKKMNLPVKKQPQNNKPALVSKHIAKPTAPMVATKLSHKDSVKEKALTIPNKIYQEEPMMALGDFKPRMKSLIKTLDISQPVITVDFYDNGAVDGDSITVFFNGKIVVSHLGLTEKPASFTLNVDTNLPYNELVMYAENMGTIPPNTALMVVKDGTKQYEVNITSDTERSGTIRFRYKPK
ncbi:MAG: hypothetical protein NVSMB45_05070 [Ginsengibacter sp.]